MVTGQTQRQVDTRTHRHTAALGWKWAVPVKVNPKELAQPSACCSPWEATMEYEEEEEEEQKQTYLVKL